MQISFITVVPKYLKYVISSVQLTHYTEQSPSWEANGHTPEIYETHKENMLQKVLLPTD
jgi:hypothetical protein